ncbi:hypothetical protein T11_2126 [Trichinella zimbabwensis]|uniref:Uncharacterized protein n=1 Tax=Trichinella zimbabwensis TaxID=268475 RepID=A0A0V1HCN7_9BILA|nr:hypothetical protein T11_2126 [Trichinella zimbabwensis]
MPLFFKRLVLCINITLILLFPVNWYSGNFCKFIWQSFIRRSRPLLGVLILPYQPAVDGDRSTILPATTNYFSDNFLYKLENM